MKQKIKFGPAGLGGVKEAVENLRKYKELGLESCEIAFTYGAYIKNKNDAVEIGNEAKRLGIKLSIHAPYWINLNSAEQEKIEKSKQRILECCKIGTWLNASKVVFHPGYFGKSSKEETYEKIKKEILDLQKTIKEKGYTPQLTPETTGKINVFGSIEEIRQLVDDTRCSFCIDFAHILARYGDYNFKEVEKKFNKFKKWHIHFSGIEYGEKGEKRHIRLKESEIKKLLKNLPKNKEITIICESPNPIEDSVISLKVYNNLE
ncbi:MAG: TIM barrel protein [Minisyncoccales bacterium]